MKWIVLSASIGACFFFGLLGLTAGINLNPESTVRFVPNWGSVGDWVSGCGAMAALAFAFWQFNLQQKNDRIITALKERAGETNWRLRLISEGFIPVSFLGAELKLGDLSRSLDRAPGNKANVGKTTKLERGDVQQIIDVTVSDFNEFSEWVLSSIIDSAKSKGLQARDLNYGICEEFFDEINYFRKNGITIIIKLAHDEILHQVPDWIVEQIFSTRVEAIRHEAELDARKKREADTASLRELFGSLEAATRSH